MRHESIDHGRATPAGVEGYQDTLDLDLAEYFNYCAPMQGEHCSQTVFASNEGAFIVLDNIPKRYSDTRSLSADSNAYLEGCLRVLQSIVGPVRRKET